MSGKLYICPTPIGNLEDMTYRTVRILSEVDLIAAEDTRHSIRLLNHFDISKPLTSYHDHNKGTKGNYLITKLLEGDNIALVSDAGMPGISDPGEEVIKQAIENNIEVEVLPGATASITALVASGLETAKFAFEGFLDRDKKNRRNQLEEIKEERRTIIFYESPHRLKDTLKDMLKVLGNRKISVNREITKKYQEIIREDMKTVIEFNNVLKKFNVNINEINEFHDNNRNNLFNNIYILDNKYVLRITDSNIISESRLIEIANLIDMYISIEVKCPMLFKANDKFSILDDNKTIYLQEYINEELLSDKNIKVDYLSHIGVLASKFTNKNLDSVNSMFSIIELAPGDIDIDEKQENFNNLLESIHDMKLKEKLIKFNMDNRSKIKKHLEELPRCNYQGDLNDSNILIKDNKFYGLIDFNYSGKEVNINYFINECRYDIEEKDIMELSNVEIYEKLNKYLYNNLDIILKNYKLNKIEENLITNYKNILFISSFPYVSNYLYFLKQDKYKNKIIELLNLIAKEL